MTRQHQDIAILTESISKIVSNADKALLATKIDPKSKEAQICAERLCDILLQYCSYRIAPTQIPINPFDDPYVGAALITSQANVLGAHRKEGRNEPHAEVETMLEALDRVMSQKSETLATKIRLQLNRKIWLNGAAAESEFISLFTDAGKIVRDHSIEKYGSTHLILLSTLEPCRDFESQPSCSRLISAFNPDAVIYGCDDTNEKGRGRPILLEHNINVVANASYKQNVEVNLLFYAAVHYLNRLHTTALKGQSRFETTYVIASLKQLQPKFFIADDSRLQIRFDDPIELPVHRAPVEWRAPVTDGPLPNAPDSDRVLFTNEFAIEFLSLYFHRHYATTNTIPGVIVCSQGVNSNSQTDKFLANLANAQVNVYTNVLRKADERFLALQSILRLDQQASAEGKLYAYVKEGGDNYSNRSGTAQHLADYLYALQAPRRVAIYYGTGALKSLKSMVTLLRTKGAFQQGHALSAASFQVFAVVQNETDALNENTTLIDWLRSAGLSHRFSVHWEVSTPDRRQGVEILHELIGGRFDPIAQDLWWHEGLLKGSTWKDRQTAGVILAQAARQDPILYNELIVSKLPSSYEEDYWRECASLLNAVAKFGRPANNDACRAIEDRLTSLSNGLDVALREKVPPPFEDIVWRYIAAAFSIANSRDVTERLFQGARLRSYIGGSPFLLKEFFFYAARARAVDASAIEFAFRLMEEHLGQSSEHDIAQVALRVTRLATLWNVGERTNAQRKLFEALKIHPRVGELCESELRRGELVLANRLAGVFTAQGDSPKQFASYLFLRTAGTEIQEDGLSKAVAREINQAVSKPAQVRVPISWRGDRTSLARLALSEVPAEEAIHYLTAMADDEDDSIKWAAVVMVMDFDFRRQLIGTAQTKERCLKVRTEVSQVLSKALSGNSHYWLRREFVNLFDIEHRIPDHGVPDSRLPVMARIQVDDVINGNALLCSDGSGEHPEVVDQLKRLRKWMKRVTLILPPIDRELSDAGRSQSSTPPLGLGSIASFLRSHGHEVQILDCHRFPNLVDELPRLVRGVDVIGFSVVTSSFQCTQSIVSEIRAELRELTPKIVLGGHAVTLHPNEFLQHRGFDWDYLVRGDGEMPLLKIVQSIDSPPGTQIPGVIARDQKNTPVVASANISSAEWNELPWIDHNLFRDPTGDPYEPSPSRTGANREAHIVVSRGCAWHCSFCTEAILRGKSGEVRRSAFDALGEIDYLIEKHAVDRIQFIDDNLLPQIAARGGVIEECVDWAIDFLAGLERICANNANFGWRGIFRFEDFVQYESLIPGWGERLRSSGCLLLAFGVEHGSEEVRKKLKGGTIPNSEIQRVISMLTSLSIATKGYFIVGGREEDQDSTSQSIDFAISSGFTLAYFALFKNFRELIRHSNDNIGTVSSRKRAFMTFKSLLADFDERISTLETSGDCLESFGFNYSSERIASAKSILSQLKENGFQFQDLFKYNDFHDNLNEVNNSVSVWKDSDGTNIAAEFLQNVRRAYFEFYTRPEFLDKYRWLIKRGY